MGSRHASRKLAMQCLYQFQTRLEKDSSFVDVFIEDSSYDQKTQLWASVLVKGAIVYINAADSLIEKYAIGWKLDRIDYVDLSILRLAFYEFSYKETPDTVIVNEAIELAKEFSSPDSPKFINGILGKYIKDKCLPE
jgi:transcription antitermination protein NusB